MKCIEVRESLDVLPDDEIGLAEREEIASHLGNCESCKAEFESWQLIGGKMKEILPLTAPASLEAGVFRAFENQHPRNKEQGSEETREKIGWFGIPKIAFAVGLLLLALFSGLAFQLGRVSADKVQIISPQVVENNSEDKRFSEEEPIRKEADDSQLAKTKIVEVPVIIEKIVKVPVVKEKTVTRTIYVEKKNNPARKTNISKENNLALNNAIKDDEFLTQTNLKGFRPVAEIKPKITKKEE